MLDPAIVLFGATGDLFRRKIVKAVLSLWHQNIRAINVICVARDDFNDETFRNHVRTYLNGECTEGFLNRIHYVQADLTKPADYTTIRHRLEENNALAGVRFYLAVSPALFAPICMGIMHAGLSDAESWGLFEKPLGENIEMAFANHLAAKRALGENNRIYADHYGRKPGLHRLLDVLTKDEEIRLSTKKLRSVEITATETIGAEGRAHYLALGGWKDMASHLWVLLGGTLGALAFPDAVSMVGRRNIVDYLPTLDPERLSRNEKVTWGQYGAGNGMLGLGEEVQDCRGCDTAIAVQLDLQVPEIRNRPINVRLMTGKRLPTKETTIKLVFGEQRNSPYRQVVTANVDPESHAVWQEIRTWNGEVLRERELYSSEHPSDDGYVALLKALYQGQRVGLTFHEFMVMKTRLVSPVAASLLASNPVIYPAGSNAPLLWQPIA